MSRQNSFIAYKNKSYQIQFKSLHGISSAQKHFRKNIKKIGNSDEESGIEQEIMSFVESCFSLIDI